jgi:hypothetical protein
METITKRHAAEQVRRSVTTKLQALAFTRGKTSFWARPQTHVIEFLHLHLFTFAPAFRVHSGIRVLNDVFVAAALNGPTSDECRSSAGRTYRLEFSDSEASIESCAAEVERFCAEVADPWFKRFREPHVLLAAESPLTDEARSGLDRALKGLTDAATVRLSRGLLGVA